VNLSANVVAAGPTLHLTLALKDAGGVSIATAITNSLGQSISANVAAGSYRLIVASFGQYGDVGQYTISGNVVVPTSASPSIPDLLSASDTGTSATDNITKLNNSAGKT